MICCVIPRYFTERGLIYIQMSMAETENQFITKAKFYQEMGLWSRTIKLNYSRWLDNFTDEEDRKIAEQILDFFVYYSSDLVDQLLIAVEMPRGQVSGMRNRHSCDSSFFLTALKI